MQRSTGTLVIFPERASGFQAVRLAPVVVMFLLVFAAGPSAADSGIATGTNSIVSRILVSRKG